MRGARGPRLARRVLSLCLPEDVVSDIVGDLEEEASERHGRGEPTRWWYWRQTLAISARFLVERMRELDPTNPLVEKALERIEMHESAARLTIPGSTS